MVSECLGGKIPGDHIIEPHFIDGKVNGKWYRNFLRNDLVNLLDEMPLESLVNIWFQQNGTYRQSDKKIIK